MKTIQTIGLQLSNTEILIGVNENNTKFYVQIFSQIHCYNVTEMTEVYNLDTTDPIFLEWENQFRDQSLNLPNIV